MKKYQKQSKQGFTLIELSLVMIFVAMLVIAIVVVANNMITIYQKGLTINAISETGKEIVNDINSSIAESPKEDYTDLCEKQGYGDCSTLEKYFPILIYHQNTSEGYPTNGTFCTGRYSYIWNTGYALRTNSNLATIEEIEFADDEDAGSTKTNYYITPRFAKVYDPLHKICAAADKGATNYETEGEIVELISDVEPRLALYNFTVFKTASDFDITNPDYRPYYTGSFLLSSELKNDDTTQVTLNKNAVDGSINCRWNDGETGQKDNAYCAINKFNFASWAMGG